MPEDKKEDTTHTHTPVETTDTMPRTEVEDFEELQEEIYTHLEALFAMVRDVTEAVSARTIRDKELLRALEHLEAVVTQRINALHLSIDAVQSRPLQKDLRFIIRLFSITYRNILLQSPLISAEYRALYKRKKGKNGHVHIENAVNIDIARITQHLVWSILRNPTLDTKTGEPIALKRFDDVFGRLFGDITDKRARRMRDSFRALRQGIIAHAAARAFLEEQGGYLSAPPEPILDAEWSIDLIAIDQRKFLDEVERLAEWNPHLDKSALLERVGSYGNGDPKKAGWIEAVRAYPSLQKLVTLVQVKSHRSSDKFAAVQPSRQKYFDQEGPRIKGLSDSLMLNRDTRLTIHESTHLKTYITYALNDFRKMRRLLEDAQYMYIDISYTDALTILKRRAL